MCEAVLPLLAGGVRGGKRVLLQAELVGVVKKLRYVYKDNSQGDLEKVIKLKI